MPTTTPTTSLEISWEEKWVIHHVMVDHLGFGPSDIEEITPYVCTLAIVEKIERDRIDFTRVELDHIRSTCRAYAESDSTPNHDVEIAQALVDRIDSMEFRKPEEPVRSQESVHRG